MIEMSGLTSLCIFGNYKKMQKNTDCPLLNRYLQNGLN